MPSHTTAVSFAPFMLWMTLGAKLGEMMWASSQVIMHRTQGLMLAHPNFTPADGREVALMGSEKIQAACASAQGMYAQMATLNMELGTLAYRQMLATATSFVSFDPRRSLWGRHSALMNEAVVHTAATASKLSTGAAQIAHRGLKPIHARVAGNVKRLESVRRKAKDR